MSDILIKGMEMPTGNNELRLIIHSNGQVFISHQTYFDETEAIPVQPHGRLIDADALKEFFPDKGEGSWTYNIVISGIIRDAPTIIPASCENPAKSRDNHEIDEEEEGK